MRGKGRHCTKFGKQCGITPAYAGKSHSVPLKYHFYKDHPRLCGEKACEESQRVCTEGSPPPMRGKGSPANAAAISLGITPAYAGKSIGAGDANPDTGDHPRLCGEK